MNLNINKELKHYFREIRGLFSFYNKEERKFMKDFKAAVSEFIEQNPTYTIADIKDQFGEPIDVVHDYIITLDPESLRKKLNLNTILTVLAVIIILILFIYLAVKYFYISDLYHHLRNRRLLRWFL